MAKVVGVLVDGEFTYHAPEAYGDFQTLCGIDADDDAIGHQGLTPAPRGQKITCVQCHAIWTGVMSLRLRKSQFSI